MQVYKRDEGMWARMPLAIVGGIVTVIATNAAMKWGAGIAPFIWAGFIFAALGIVTLYLAFFHKKIGGVLIDTENEMRKVVWPSREEVTGSTIVVIFATILLGAAIFAVDIILAHALSLVGLYRV